MTKTPEEVKEMRRIKMKELRDRRKAIVDKCNSEGFASLSNYEKSEYKTHMKTREKRRKRDSAVKKESTEQATTTKKRKSSSKNTPEVDEVTELKKSSSSTNNLKSTNTSSSTSNNLCTKSSTKDCNEITVSNNTSGSTSISNKSNINYASKNKPKNNNQKTPSTTNSSKMVTRSSSSKAKTSHSNKSTSTASSSRGLEKDDIEVIESEVTDPNLLIPKYFDDQYISECKKVMNIDLSCWGIDPKDHHHHLRLQMMTNLLKIFGNVCKEVVHLDRSSSPSATTTQQCKLKNLISATSAIKIVLEDDVENGRQFYEETVDLLSVVYKPLEFIQLFKFIPHSSSNSEYVEKSEWTHTFRTFSAAISATNSKQNRGSYPTVFKDTFRNPLTRFSVRQISKRENFEKHYSNYDAVSGNVMEAMVVYYLHKSTKLECKSCKMKNAWKWGGGSGGPWKDVYCSNCNSTYEIKSKGTINDVMTFTEPNSVRKLYGGSFRDFLKIRAQSKNDDKRKQYVLLVNREPEELMSRKFHRVYIAEIIKVTPAVKPKTFAKLYSKDEMSLKSEIHHKAFDEKAWLAFQALPKSRYKIIDEEKKRLTQKYFPK